MHYISANGCSFNFPNQCSFYKHGCAQRTEVPRKDLSFKKYHGCVTNPLRSHSKNIGVNGISTRNYNKSETMLSFYWYRLLHERKRVVHTPSLATEIGFTHDDANNDDKFAMFFNHLNKHLNAFYRFSRPHTIIGTLIGVTSVSLLPIHSVADLSLEFLIGWLKALIPSVLMNIYVVGLNQLFDVQIDKVNKPDLPLASGEFSMGAGTMIVSLSCLLSFGLGFAAKSPPLLMALFTSFLLGSVYSIDLPMLRWKKQPILATACIVTVRALMLQLAFFIHTQKYVLGRPIMLTRSVLFATTFMCFFVTVIALFKDIPDVDGDKHFGIKSFSVTLGKEKVFWLCIKLLLGAYGFAIALGANSPSLPAMKLATIIGHSTLATMLLVRAQSVDLGEKASITSFYMFIWKLFYAEYFLIPLIRW